MRRLQAVDGSVCNLQIDLQATTGYKDCIFGGEATFDTNKQDVTKWSAGVGVFQKQPVC